jgi:hypothetical protein
MVRKQLTQLQLLIITITDTNYRLDIDRVADGGNKFSPTYTFTGNGNTYVFNYTTDASATVTLSVNGVKQDDIPVSITISEQLQQRHLQNSITDGPVTLNINNLIKDTETKLNKDDTQSKSKATVNVNGTTPITQVQQKLNKKYS